MNNILVSMLLVVRNAENYIEKSLYSLINQGFKKDEFEIIVIDGMSEDKTKEIVSNYLVNVDYNYQILDNKKRILSSGWNIGIKNAKGKYVVRPDAHGALHKNYIKYGLEILEQKPDITAVGGILETKAKGFWGNIIKEALSSKVGVGNSSFRIATKSGYYDTAVYAIYRKEIFDKVGYFNENLVRHQDNDMHRRIKDVGGRFYLDIRMKADYYCRDTVSKLLKQMYNIGRYIPNMMSNGSLSVRHFSPFLFYMVIFISVLVGFIYYPSLVLFIIIFCGYIGIITIDSIIRVVKNKKISILLNIFIIPMMHFAYAMGTLIGLLKKLKG